MADPFVGVWEKLDRARYHADDLRSQILAYGKSEPYEIVGKSEPNRFVWSIKSVDNPLPMLITTIAGDAVHNLRAAFDHFAYVAVPQPHNRNVGFPICRKGSPSAAAWRGIVNGQLNGASPALLSAVNALQCYEGGTEEWVWTIDYLDIVDKHRLLLTVASAHTGIILRVLPRSDVVPRLEFPIMAAEWTPVEPDVELMIIQGSSEPGNDADPKFTFDVTFDEPQIPKGQAVFTMLSQLIEDSEKLLKNLVLLA